jgi:predicted MPP superfamily phosphohydrolase
MDLLLTSLLISAGLGAAGLLFYMFFVEPFKLSVEQVNIGIKNLPPTLDGFVICHISDAHFTNLGPLELKLIESLSQVNPHICVLTGDMVDRAEGFEVLRQVFGNVNPPFGIYAVPGNGEVRLGIPFDELRSRLCDIGITLLRNSHVDLLIDGVNLSIIGVDDPFNGFDDLDTAMANLPSEGFRLLLAHSPDVFAQLLDRKIDLVLAGHTHGGQVCFPFIGPLWLHCRYNFGLSNGYFGPDKLSRAVRHNISDCHLYVSRGVGSGSLRPRLLCSPELAIIRLHSLKDHS